MTPQISNKLLHNNVKIKTDQIEEKIAAGRSRILSPNTADRHKHQAPAFETNLR